jgi:hypothetical protein
MKIWKKILIVNIIITLAIMAYFVIPVIPYLIGKEAKYSIIECSTNLQVKEAHAIFDKSYDKWFIYVIVSVNNDSITKVEIHMKTINDSYILFSRGYRKVPFNPGDEKEGYFYKGEYIVWGRTYDKNSYNFKPLTISSTHNYSHPVFQGNYVFDIPDECWQDYQNGYDKVYVNDYGYAVIIAKESDREHLNFTGYYYEKTDSRVYMYDSTKMDWILRPDENGTNYNGYYPLVILRQDIDTFVQTNGDMNIYYNYHTLDAYAIGYYNKTEITYYDVIRFSLLITQLGYGLLFSAIAFVVVWVLVFIVWVIAYHIIGFIEWLKR